MANKSPRNPYLDLMLAARKYINSFRYRKKIEMCYLPKEDVVKRTAWRFDDVANKVEAAQQLGYECVLEWDGNRGLLFKYRKLPADPPYPFN